MKKELDKLQEAMGFSGRSEAIRAGLRLLIADQKQLSKMSGKKDAALIVVHEDKHSENISTIRHKHENIIKP